MEMKMMARKAQQGFTLIELMIVVAIIGILAAVAIPQYQDYVARSRLGAMVTGTDAVKLAMAEGFKPTVYSLLLLILPPPVLTL